MNKLKKYIYTINNMKQLNKMKYCPYCGGKDLKMHHGAEFIKSSCNSCDEKLEVVVEEN